MGAALATCNGYGNIASDLPLDVKSVTLSPHTGNGAALTFEGGGFMAFSIQAGFTSALLALAAKQTGQTASLKTSGLFERFGSLASNSGGSWFAGQLAYSQKFCKMIESMAADPNTAGTQFDKGWVDGWLTLATDDPIFVKAMAELAKLARSPALAQNIAEIGFFLSHTFTWQEFVTELMKRTAEIEKDTLLGSAVNDWAIGKSWMLVNSLSTLSDSDTELWNHGLFSVSPCLACCLNEAHYRASSSDQIPSYMPAKYSIVLGSGQDATAAVPYVADGSNYSSTSLAYTKTTQLSACICKNVSTSTSATLDFSSLEGQGGSLSFISTVSSSSAFLGQAITTAFSQALIDDANGQLAIWHQKGDAPLVFEGAFQALKQNDFEHLAPFQVMAAIDGYVVDNTGIATAVQTGAREIVAFVGLTGESANDQSLSQLFASASANGLYSNPQREKLKVESAGYTFALEEKTMGYAIFEQPTGSNINEELKKLQHLPIKDGKGKQLEDLKYGTLSGLRTVENPDFGIPAGEKVTLHILYVNTKLGLGTLEDFHNYSVLVQEIVTTFLDNESLVQKDIMPWFFPK